MAARSVPSRLRIDGLAVENQLRVELARSPAAQHAAHGRRRDAEQVDERLQVGRECDDRSDVQVTIRPSVQPVADAGRERIVHSGMTERALDAHRTDRAAGIQERGHADDCIRFEQRDRVRRIVEVERLPARSAAATGAGTALTSTLRPSASACAGETPGPTPPLAAPAMASWSRSVSPQNASSPNVSNRKICLPCWKSASLLAAITSSNGVTRCANG